MAVIICLSWLSLMVFSYKLRASAVAGGPSSSCEMIILRNNGHGGIIRVCKYSHTNSYNSAMTVIAQGDHLTPVVQFYCLWKINSCLSTPNDTRNRVLPTNKTKEYYNGNIFFLRVTSNLLLISFPSCIRISPFFYLFSFSFSSSLEVIASLVIKPFIE